MELAKKTFKRIELDQPLDENEYVLVSGQGRTTNE